jgi:hypothetical protein
MSNMDDFNEATGPSWRNGEILGARAFTLSHTMTCDGSH